MSERMVKIRLTTVSEYVVPVAAYDGMCDDAIREWEQEQAQTGEGLDAMLENIVDTRVEIDFIEADGE